MKVSFGHIGATLRELSPYVAFALALFATGAAIGAYAPAAAAGAAEALTALATTLRGRGVLEIVGFIFLKNATAAAVAIVLGVAGGLVPAAAALLNGIALGAVASAAAARGVAVWANLLPHGVFELPAIFIAWALGLWLGAAIWTKARRRLLNARLRAAARVYGYVILPLLIVAAAIEGARLAALWR